MGLCIVASAGYLFQRARPPSVDRGPVTPSATPSDERHFFVDEEGVTHFELGPSPNITADLPIGGRPPLEPTRTPTSAPTATLTPSPDVPPVARVVQNAHCQAGPGTAYRVLTSLESGSLIALVGRSESGSWLAVQAAGLMARCWVFGESLDAAGVFDALPVLPAPPLPTASPTLVPGCLVWVPNLQKNVCTVPCPPNSNPGGACTP